MFELLIRFIFTVVSQITNAILQPVINVIINLFPSVNVHLSYIFTFLSSASTYLATILRWFLITPQMLMLLFDYFFIKWSIWVVASAVRLTLKVYNALKP